MFITSPEKAARQILAAVRRNRRRGPDRSRRQGHRFGSAATGDVVPARSGTWRADSANAARFGRPRTSRGPPYPVESRGARISDLVDYERSGDVSASPWTMEKSTSSPSRCSASFTKAFDQAETGAETRRTLDRSSGLFLGRVRPEGLRREQPATLSTMLRLGRRWPAHPHPSPRPSPSPAHGHAFRAVGSPHGAPSSSSGRRRAVQAGLDEVRIGLTLPWFADRPALDTCSRLSHFDFAVRDRDDVRSAAGQRGRAYSTPCGRARGLATGVGRAAEDFTGVDRRDHAGHQAAKASSEDPRRATGRDRHGLSPTPTVGEGRSPALDRRRGRPMTTPKGGRLYGPQIDRSRPWRRPSPRPCRSTTSAPAIYLSPDVFGWAAGVGLVQPLRVLLRGPGRACSARSPPTSSSRRWDGSAPTAVRAMYTEGIDGPGASEAAARMSEAHSKWGDDALRPGRRARRRGSR